MGRGGEEEDIIESSMISSKKTQMEKLTCLPVTKREYAQKAKNNKKKTKISGSIVSIRFPFEQVGEAARRHIYAVCFTSLREHLSRTLCKAPSYCVVVQSFSLANTEAPFFFRIPTNLLISLLCLRDKKSVCTSIIC